MISIYSSAFNLVTNKFNYIFSIDQFCQFADEVVVAVNSSIDNTLQELHNLSYDNLNIISTDISYDDPLLDGKIKNEALQHTKHPVKIGLDIDEYIPLSQKNMWYALSDMLLQDNCMCYMIPSINLYKDCYHYFSITPKWYLHKSGLYRGPVNFAKKDNGYIDTNKSDTCELIDINSNLVPSKTTPCDIGSLRAGGCPFVVHMGYLSLEDRLIRNQNFWSKHWLIESGGQNPPHKIHKKLEDFQEKFEEHKLTLI
jgi:hypothetical protein